VRALVLHCEFIAHSYQGVRLTPDQIEELDWPPSPARLHQALMAAAFNGIPPGEVERLAARSLEGLRWLEGQPPPQIVASVIAEEPDSATHFRLADAHTHYGWQVVKSGRIGADTYTHENLIDHLRRAAYYGIAAVQSMGIDKGEIAYEVRANPPPNAALFRIAGRGMAMPNAGPGREYGGRWLTA
jgi:hypothetical protein